MDDDHDDENNGDEGGEKKDNNKSEYGGARPSAQIDVPSFAAPEFAQAQVADFDDDDGTD